MAAWRCTASSRSSLGCSDGFTIVEALVALVVAGLLVAGAVSVTLSSRQGYDSDQYRTHVNQNLRAALDILGVDIRQAGERLPGDFPALVVVDGASGAPDQLILRRNLLDEVLPLCQRLLGGNVGTKVLVASTGTANPQGCFPVADENGDGSPDNIDVWRDFRTAAGGATWVYLYYPAPRVGQWFLYDDDGPTSYELAKGDDGPWNMTYPKAGNCRIYMLEQRTYRLEDGVLQFLENQDSTEPIHLSTDIVDFQVRGVLADGTIVDAFDSDDDWVGLAAIEVSLTGSAEFDGRTVTRTVSARFFPRNVLSHG